MKNILATIGVLVCFIIATIPLHAQLTKRIDASDLVVKGEVVEKKVRWSDDNSQIISENKIRISKIFRGSVVDSFITVISLGGSIDDELQYLPHGINLKLYDSGYFVLSKSYHEHGEFTFLDLKFGYYEIYSANDHYRANPYVLFQGTKISTSDFEDKIVTNTRTIPLTFEEYNRLSESVISQESEGESCDFTSSKFPESKIDFRFDNIHFTSNFSHLEFDVIVEVNRPGLKFGKGDIALKYSATFGENVTANSGIEIVKGEILANENYSIIISDETNSSVKTVVSSSLDDSNELYTLSQSPEMFYHVKLKIESLESIGSISFNDIGISGNIFYYCKGEYIPFDSVTYDSPISSVEPFEGSEIGLTYQFQNSDYSEAENEVSVDIFASSTGNSNFSNAFIYIDYNSNAFGENIVASGNFNFTRGDVIFDMDQYDIFISDLDENTVQLVIFTQGDGENFSTLNTVPSSLGRLSFIVENCSVDKGIKFNELTLESDHTYFTGNMPLPNTLYDPVIANDVEVGQACGCEKPAIVSFSPAIITAGTGSILTITGSNFGDFSIQNSTILFPDGDNGGATLMEAGPADFMWDNITHWTDREIKIKVPSTDKNINSGSPASTGKFKVRNNCQVSELSEERLNVSYAILSNRISPFGPAFKMTLKENSSPGICFQFSEDMPGWMRAAFREALSVWCQVTSINFTIGDPVDDSINIGLDNINIIKYAGASSVAGGETVVDPVYLGSLCTSTPEPMYSFSEIDFRLFGRDVIVPTDEEINNLKEAIVHEIGHAHMVDHANSGNGASQYLMNFDGNIGGVITANDAEAANLVFQNSLIFSQSCGTTPIGTGICGQSCTATSVFENTDQLNLKVWPNPSSGNLNLELNDHVGNIIELLVYNSAGRLISKEYNISDSSAIISLPNNPGLYIIVAKTSTYIFQSKVVRL